MYIGDDFPALSNTGRSIGAVAENYPRSYLNIRIHRNFNIIHHTISHTPTLRQSRRVELKIVHNV